ncbi:MAG TPA: prolyl oligopeptidase family serine peptidase [Phycisphaerales bacterium]|nr:prolyl oligopeptidase family serine peptidase [Phycisphaerales bacterium]
MPSRMRGIAPALGAVLGLWGAAPAVAQPVPTFPNQTYATIGGRALQLDVYLPVGTGPFPCVVWVHGGGWQSGERFPPGPALQLLPRGIAVASVSYRLTSEAGQWGGEPVTFPAQIHDVKGAIRFLRANAAAYQLNPARFGAWGSSAGGHLVALAGTSGNDPSLEGTVGGNLDQSSALQAIGDYFGPTDIININLDVTTPPGSTINHDAFNSPESKLVGWDDPGQGIGDIRANLANPAAPYPALVALCNQVNSITFVDPADPPFYIAHGTADTSVPIMQSTRLSNALGAAGVFRDYRQIAGAGHGGLGQATDTGAVNFFAHFLLPPVCLGDHDHNGSIGLGDIAPVVQHWGTSVPPGTLGDSNGDGFVGLADIAFVVEHWGELCV